MSDTRRLWTILGLILRAALSAFIFWSAWSAVTNRPGEDASYTNNWPAERLVGNAPTTPTFLWTIVSILFLLAGVGALAWWHATQRRDVPLEVPHSDPLRGLEVTLSMRATAKYFWLVVALFAVQVLLGAVTAHYAVEGQAFYGFPLADYVPYSLTRTWHTQLSVLWIATAWLGTGLYIAPAISGREPKLQRLGVNVLFGALLLVVIGAFTGQWFAVMQRMGLDLNFWFGHQGYEYVDIGRVWQIALFGGLMFWLFLVGRALWPALRRGAEHASITMLLFLSTIAIGLFYGAGLMWGQHTHLSMVEYWRWWVVHLWVEGFFEVFATAVLAIGASFSALELFCLRGLAQREGWSERLIATSFWSLNAGLALMALLSLLPLGLMQVYASVQHGFWFARSAEFLQQPVMQLLVWLRVPGDVIFSIGVVALVVFVARLWWRRAAPVAGQVSPAAAATRLAPR